MTQNKYIKITFVLIASIIILSAGWLLRGLVEAKNMNNAKAVGVNFVSSVDVKNYAEAYKLLSSSQKELMSQDEFSTALKNTEISVPSEENLYKDGDSYLYFQNYADSKGTIIKTTTLAIEKGAQGFEVASFVIN